MWALHDSRRRGARLRCLADSEGEWTKFLNADPDSPEALGGNMLVSMAAYVAKSGALQYQPQDQGGPRRRHGQGRGAGPAAASHREAAHRNPPGSSERDVGGICDPEVQRPGRRFAAPQAQTRVNERERHGRTVGSSKEFQGSSEWQTSRFYATIVVDHSTATEVYLWLVRGVPKLTTFRTLYVQNLLTCAVFATLQTRRQEVVPRVTYVHRTASAQACRGALLASPATATATYQRCSVSHDSVQGSRIQRNPKTVARPVGSPPLDRC